MDYAKKDLLSEGDVSEVREPVATYVAGGRAAVEPWAGSGTDRADGDVVCDAEWTRIQEELHAHGRMLAAELGITTDEEFIAMVNEEVHLSREEESDGKK